MLYQRSCHIDYTYDMQYLLFQAVKSFSKSSIPQAKIAT